MKKYFKLFVLIFALSFSLVQFGCSAAIDAFTNLQRLQFKLGAVNNFNLAGINIGRIRTISDFSIIDGAKLLSAFTSGKFPASFTLNVLAKNPNDGTGGTKKTSAVLKSLAWRLFLDDKETINGNISRNIEIPGVGQETTIPVDISLDLYQFFKDQGYDHIVNLALALGGVSGSSARIKLKATPTVDTFLGPIKYPGEITIVDKEFRSQ
jgi:hypothetical protein